MIPGGSEPPHLFGENSSHAILTQKEANQIIAILQTTSVKECSNQQIANQFNICIDQVRRINNGQC